MGGAGTEFAELLALPDTPDVQAGAAIAAAITTGNVSALIAALRARYNQGVKPDLVAASGSGDSLFQALAQWQLWFGWMTDPIFTAFAGQIISALSAEMTEARELAAAALRGEIGRANAECIARQSLLAASSPSALTHRSPVPPPT